MKFLVVTVVFIGMLVMGSQAEAHFRIRKLVRAPIHITQRTAQIATSPVRVVKKNVKCRVQARKCRRANRRCN